MDGICSDDSGIKEERAGGGPEQEDRAWIRADDVYPENWRSTHLSDDGGDTPRASGQCMCDLHMHMYRYDCDEHPKKTTAAQAANPTSDGPS